MGGFSIGFGVGLRYPTPNRIKGSAPPVISRPILAENGMYVASENNNYLKLEDEVKASTMKTKSYWNFGKNIKG